MCCLNPALNESSEILHFERSDAIEIRDRIINLTVYTGLPHVLETLLQPWPERSEYFPRPSGYLFNRYCPMNSMTEQRVVHVAIVML